MIGLLARTVLGGLMLAGIVHVVAVLTIPDVAPADPVDRVFRVAVPGAMTPIPADGTVLQDLDPFFHHAVCLVDPAGGPVEVSGPMPPDLWTVAVVGEREGVAGSLERGGVADGRLELVVGRPAEVERIRLDRVESGRVPTVVEIASGRGFVLVRAFAGRGVDRAAMEAAIAALACAPAR